MGLSPVKPELSVPILPPAFPRAEGFHCKHLILFLTNVQPKPLTQKQIYYTYVTLTVIHFFLGQVLYQQAWWQRLSTG